MDIKTLSTIIGHASAETTLDIYAHSTDEMQRNAAISIDKGIAGVEPPEREVAEPMEATPQTFEPKKLSRRRPGTGCISQIQENLWEGRYSPKWIDGKKHPRNIYAHTEDECEEKLAQLILDMKAELAQLRAAQKAEMNAQDL